VDPGYCLDAADVNDNGNADISDAIGSLGFQFLGEREPAAPWPLCGADSLPDETPSLGCLHSSCP
jgi:hypothetical protein